MKIQVLAATAVLALFASTAASAGGYGGGYGGGKTLNITNNSAGSIAVGDTLVAAAAVGPAGGAGFIGLAGGRAYAGSVLVRSCGCYKKINIKNNSAGSIAVGKATSGSVVVTGASGKIYH